MQLFTFTFIRCFYPKRLTLHSSYSFYILSALAFPGNRTHDLGVASAMLYQLSYRKASNNTINRLETKANNGKSAQEKAFDRYLSIKNT